MSGGPPRPALEGKIDDQVHFSHTLRNSVQAIGNDYRLPIRYNDHNKVMSKTLSISGAPTRTQSIWRASIRRPALLTMTVFILLFGIDINATGSNVDDDPGVGKDKSAQGGDGDPIPFNISKTWQRITNTQADKALREFCGLHNLSIEEHGSYPVKALLIGGVKIPTIEADLKIGTQALAGLEAWTGRQEFFLRKHPGEGETIEVVIFASDADYDSYLDFFCTHRELTLVTDSSQLKGEGGIFKP